MENNHRQVFLDPKDQAELNKVLEDLGLGANFLIENSTVHVKDFDETGLNLVFDKEAGMFKLLDPKEKTWHGLCVDFLDPTFRFRVERSANSKEILRDALKLKGKSQNFVVWDVFAGLGEDAFMMAHWGHRVKSYERHPLIYFLLMQGWQHFCREKPDEAKGHDWKLHCSNSLLEPSSALSVDVVYMDPMFDSHGKKSLNKKEMRILSELISEPAPTPEEVEAAFLFFLAFAKHKVILKRPTKAPLIKCPKNFAYYSVEGPSIRLDVYNRVAT